MISRFITPLIKFFIVNEPWIRYSSYEYKTGNDANPYIMVSKGSKPEMYHPMLEAEKLVIDAINIGLSAMHKAPEEELEKFVFDFIHKYGFLLVLLQMCFSFMLTNKDSDMRMYKHCTKAFVASRKGGMSFAARSAKTSLMFTNQWIGFTLGKICTFLRTLQLMQSTGLNCYRKRPNRTKTLAALWRLWYIEHKEGHLR